ncbi:Uncharacterised protein [Mycoplasmopsis fermentans]|nr:Uncharacterised protein [Mycoplasmopsis fermentans]
MHFQIKNIYTQLMLLKKKKKKRYYSKKFIKNNLKMGLYENKKWELKKRSLNLNYSVANPLYVVV